KIADILQARGQLDDALRINEERLPVFEHLGDPIGKAHVFYSMAQIELDRKQYPEATSHLAEAFQLVSQVGYLDGVVGVGLLLGQLLCAGGMRKEGHHVLIQVRDGKHKMGQDTSDVEALLEQCPPEE
ncbi:hypothetical protein, partial [Endothiovibrio diazotrophicus]